MPKPKELVEYTLMVTTSVCLLLSGVAGVYFVSGTLEFTPGGVLAGKAESGTIMLLLALFAFGTAKPLFFLFTSGYRTQWLHPRLFQRYFMRLLWWLACLQFQGDHLHLWSDLLSETNGSDWMAAAFTIYFHRWWHCLRTILKRDWPIRPFRSPILYLVRPWPIRSCLGAAMHCDARRRENHALLCAGRFLWVHINTSLKWMDWRINPGLWRRSLCFFRSLACHPWGECGPVVPRTRGT